MTPISATPTLPLVLPHSEAASIETSKKVAGEGADIFGEMLSTAAAQANQRLNQGQAAGEAFAAGSTDDIHGTMLALSQADIELKLVGSVRNKVIDAFYELWRMQI
ncbi:MAG TPA: flagellar hook-basal body complex protein FliE [Polyangiaceae bacterium]|nr:flagellar hook-basal body complex protein FliE [Polyangiaceae bacterium]